MAVIGKNEIEGLIPVEYSNQIIEGIVTQSVALQLLKKLPSMAAGVLKMPVVDLLPMAYFVDNSGNVPGLKQTTAMAWKHKTITAEEIAVIIPIPESYLEDSGIDIWAEVKPRAQEAFAALVDSAILFGYQKPASWPDGIAVAAHNKNNKVVLGTGSDVYDDIMGENGLIAKLEQEGFMVDGFVADLSMRSKLRGLRATTGEPIFTQNIQEQTTYLLDGQPIYFPRNGSFAHNIIAQDLYTLMIAGEWKQAVYSVRKDLTFKILTEGVIQDPSNGNILYNLAQQDMVALRMVMRMGWQVPNPVNRVEANENNRYPFAVLELSTGQQ